MTQENAGSLRTFFLVEAIPRNEQCSAKTVVGTRQLHCVESVSPMLLKTRNLACL